MSPPKNHPPSHGLESNNGHSLGMSFWRSPQMHPQHYQNTVEAQAEGLHPQAPAQAPDKQAAAPAAAHQRAQSSVSQFPPILPPIPRVASQLDASSSAAGTRPRHTPGSAQEEGFQHEQGFTAALAEESSVGESAPGPPPSLSFDQLPPYPQFPPPVTTVSLSPVHSSPSPASDVASASQLHSHLPPRLARRSMTSPDGLLRTSPAYDSVSPSSAGSDSRSGSGSAILGVPYSSTMSREKPRSGDRPLLATSTINGIPQHFSRAPSHRNDAPPPPSKSRARLNLLNPVNLLMRRRSSQAVESGSDKSSTKSLIVPPMDLPDDYDPRIKGNKVHDFSAPRTRRNLSYNDAVGSAPTLDVSLDGEAPSTSSLDPIQQSPPDAAAAAAAWTPASDMSGQEWRKSNQHTPVFVEHFDPPADDRGPSAVHAETLANSGFLARNSWQSVAPVAPPPFGRKSQQLDEQQVHAVVSPNNRSSDPASISSTRSDTDYVHGLGFRLSDPTPSSPDTAPTIHSRPVSKDLNLAEQASSPVIQPRLDSADQRISSPVVSPLSSPVPYPQSSPAAHSPPSPGAQRLSTYSQGASPNGAQSQSSSVNENSRSVSGGLRHLPSSASRFSFQMAGLDSMAEEKLLEDKHKLRHSSQPDYTLDMDEDDEDDDDDDFFDEDAMYDHDEMEGFDEPEVFGGNNVFQRTHNRSDSSTGMTAGILGLHFSDPAPSHIAASTDPSTAPHAPQQQTTTLPTTPGSPVRDSSGTDQFAQQLQRSPPFQLASVDIPTKPTSPASANSFYFDDGMIDELDDTHDGPRDRDGNVFDEDQFDDPSFLKKPQDGPGQTCPSSASHQPGKSPSTYNVDGYDFLIHNPHNTTARNLASDSPDSGNSSTRNSVGPLRHDSIGQDGGRGRNAQDSLSAYHSALAEAAHKAAADGRFTRQPSTATSVSVYSDAPESGPSEPLHNNNNQVQDQRQFQYVHDRMASASTFDMQHNTRPSYSGFEFDFHANNRSSVMSERFFSPEMPSDEFGYRFPPDDDSYDFDDPDLIAAANAEALSADDSGMYSQEFGFYAKPRPGSAEGEMDMHGGYFGQPGIEIQRQKSLREPNLTPITERSEFSTRNSFIAGPGSMGGPWSPHSHAGSVQGLPSPALSATVNLAQQRGMSPLARTHLPENDNLTLAEIRKGLHANAYSGSNGSISSDYGPALSSPGEYGAARPYSPALHNAGPAGVPGAGYYMPAPRASNHGMGAMGGVPMTWQHSTDSNGSHPSHHSYSSSPGLPSSPAPMPVIAADPPASHQFTQAQAFSFFDAGGESDGEAGDNHGSHRANSYLDVEGNEGSNSVTPRKPASTPHQHHDLSSPPPLLPSYPQTPSTARKMAPAAITTPSYTSMNKPSLGSPLRTESFPTPPKFADSPTSTSSAMSNDRPFQYSPLASPKTNMSPAHQRVGSGADSVTYVQERDLTTGTKRWVLERRRTSEQGFLELIGREIVEGGRI